MTAAAQSDTSPAQTLPQLRLKRPIPARGVLSPPHATQSPPRLTRLSDAAVGSSPFTRLVEIFLYFWTVVAIILGLMLACLVLYLLYFKNGGSLAPTLPFNLAAYGGLAITVASCLGLYGLLHHRRIVTEGKRNYSLGMFIILGAIGAIFVVVGGAMALSLVPVIELAEDGEFSSDRVVVLETNVISSLYTQVLKSSSGWRDIQNELQCCGYDQVSTIEGYLSPSSCWDLSVKTAIEEANAVGGRYCSTRIAECMRDTSEEHCPVSGHGWCRSELMKVVIDNYSLLGTCAITFGAVQVLFSAFGLFTLLCDVRRISGLSPIYEIPHRTLSPIQPSD